MFKSGWLALLGGLLLTACTADQMGAGLNIATQLAQGYSVSNQQLATAARRSALALDNKYTLAPPQSSYAKRLQRLTGNLRYFDGLHLNYGVYLSDQINAFAMPDGTVRVFSALMDSLNDDELLAVIGHEIGHVKHQHSLQQFRKAYAAKAAAAGLIAYGGENVAALTKAYGNIGLKAVSARFSQKDEHQADAYGVLFLKRLGRNPYAAVTVQKKLQANSHQAGGIFASHPASKARIERTTEMARRITQKK